MKRKLLLALAVLIPLGLFVAAREAASWRPKVLGEVRGRSPKLTISPDGRWLLTHSDFAGKSDWLWDLNSRQKVRTLPPGVFYVISPDNRTLAVIDDVESELSSNGYEFASAPTLRFFNLRTGHPLRATQSPELRMANETRDAAFSLDGRRLVVATNYALYQFDAVTGRLLKESVQQPTATEWPIYRKIARDARHVISQGLMTRIHNIPNGALKSSLGTHGHELQNAGWSPNGVLVWELNETEHRFCNAQTGKLVRQWRTNGKSGVHFTPDSKHLAVAKGNRLELRDVLTGKLTKTLPGPRAEPFQIAPDGSFAVSVEGGKLLRWRLK